MKLTSHFVHVFKKMVCTANRAEEGEMSKCTTSSKQQKLTER